MSVKIEDPNRYVAEDLLTRYLKVMGINVKDPNFVQTPERIYRMHKNMLYALTKEGKKEVKQILKKTFPSKDNDMVVFAPLEVATLCPHHWLTVRLTIIVAYIPKGNEVIGLSKIPRLVELLAKQPILQEDLLHLIADTLYKNTSNSGVYVIVLGRHSCMCDRGVKTSARTGDSAIRGAFQKQATRDEALKIAKFLMEEKNRK